MRIVVVGATSVIAQNCVKVWASQGSKDFVLVGRSSEKLNQVSADLALRYPGSKFSTSVVEFGSSRSINDLVLSLTKNSVDMALIAQGSLTEQSKASVDLEYLQTELKLNAVSAAIFAEAFSSVFETQGSGTLGIIGSVAGDRGRAYNYSYGASKALLETYSQGLQQRFSKTPITVCLIKPGPTETPMTVNHKGPKARPEKVAKIIVAGLKNKKRVIYAPGSWRLVMFVVRLIPFAIFRHLKF